MCPSYVRIRLSITEATLRFSRWVGLPELGPATLVNASESVDKASDNHDWRSVVAVFIYESDGWTVFEDLTGHLASFSAQQWRDLAGAAELVFAGYNDAIPYGQLIVVCDGKITRDFIDDRQDPSHNVNSGRLPFEADSPINDWISAASFVDEDEFAVSPDEGLLWLFGSADDQKK